MCTNIEDLKVVSVELKEDSTESLKQENLSKTVVDFSLPLDTRIKAINLFYKKEGGDNTIELVNKISMMYDISGTKVLREYLFNICTKSELEPFLKGVCAKSLCEHNFKDDIGFQAIDIVYPQLGADIGTPYKIEFIKLLMKNEKYKDKALFHMCNTVNDLSIDCAYRYKIILSIDNTNTTFIKSCCKSFLVNDKNLINFRILACQFMLVKCGLEGEEKTEIENILISFANDTNIEYNTRADATDIVLQYGSPESKTIASDIIMKLGVGNRKIHTVYDNAQNVHTKEIEESVNTVLEFFQSFDISKKPDGKYIDISYIEKRLTKLLYEEKNILELKENEKYEKEERIKLSLERISMDRALYSRYNCTLLHILLKVWTYISGHDCEIEMKNRLLEELSEMAGTCSSGYATRLVNTISGFGDFSIRISWGEQITSNLNGRLNAKIRDMDNLKLQEKVLAQMTLETNEYEKRRHFLKFLREHISSIREEMYVEFREHMTDEDYDLFFRRAVSMYETGNF